MTGITEILLLSALVALCFPIGAILSLRLKISHRMTAAFMSLGAGLLIAASFLDLINGSLHELALSSVILMVVLAAAVFSLINWWLARRGAKHRKRCATCLNDMQTELKPDNGLAITLGTILDAIPEALVLGVTLTGNGSAIPLAVALGLGNVAQSISSTSGLKASNISTAHIMTLWIGLAVITTLATLMSYALLGTLGPNLKPWLEAFAAGILLAMVCEAMLPEAHHKSPSFTGLIGVGGICLYLVIHGML